MNRNLHLARQPIVDRAGALVGFELLFRAAANNGGARMDGRTATAEVIIDAFLELGIEKALRGRLGFVNVDEHLLFDDAVLLLPKQNLVLELLETIRIDAHVIARARELARIGYSLALDDVVACEPVEPLLPFVDVVKLDVLAIRPGEVGTVLRSLRRASARPLKLLAEKVETPEQMHACMDLGFDLFQGYHFARPEILQGRRLQHSQAVLLRLLSLVHKGAGAVELEAEIRHHPQIAYDLIRLVNSASFGLAESVCSLRRAVVVLGSRQLGRWIQLLIYGAGGDAAEGARRNREPLMQLAATRARFVELLVELEAPGDLRARDLGFLTGVLSLLDVLFSATMHEICDALKLPGEVENALLRREGLLGRLLELVERIEAHDHASVERMLERSPALCAQQLAAAELAALAWANEVGDECRAR
ncbi:MAG: EAL and HDOD domain-containing protein [Planctomycetota bacterium]